MFVHEQLTRQVCCVSLSGMNEENGADSTLGEDSDSAKAYKAGGIIPPTKEKKKPFFKKVTTFLKNFILTRKNIRHR